MPKRSPFGGEGPNRPCARGFDSSAALANLFALANLEAMRLRRTLSGLLREADVPALAERALGEESSDCSDSSEHENPLLEAFYQRDWGCLQPSKKILEALNSDKGMEKLVVHTLRPGGLRPRRQWLDRFLGVFIRTPHYDAAMGGEIRTWIRDEGATRHFIIKECGKTSKGAQAQLGGSLGIYFNSDHTTIEERQTFLLENPDGTCKIAVMEDSSLKPQYPTTLHSGRTKPLDVPRKTNALSASSFLPWFSHHDARPNFKPVEVLIAVTKARSLRRGIRLGHKRRKKKEKTKIGRTQWDDNGDHSREEVPSETDNGVEIPIALTKETLLQSATQLGSLLTVGAEQQEKASEKQTKKRKKKKSGRTQWDGSSHHYDDEISSKTAEITLNWLKAVLSSKSPTDRPPQPQEVHDLFGDDELVTIATVTKRIFPAMCKRQQIPEIKNVLGSNILKSISARDICLVFDEIPRGGNEFANVLASLLPRIEIISLEEKATVQARTFDKLGKRGRDRIKSALKLGENVLEKAKRRQAAAKDEPQDDTNPNQNSPSQAGKRLREDATEVQKLQAKVRIAMKRFFVAVTNQSIVVKEEVAVEQAVDDTKDLNDIAIESTELPDSRMSPEEVVAQLTRCDQVPEDEAETLVTRIEKSFDFSCWDSSLWVVEITEQAHKWFRKSSKKQHLLRDRVIRRLQILSTGRWPYVLCKPVRTAGDGAIKLYETKIDKARRIIWEVAVSFSPRRSSANHYLSEQVIRVWDVVEDHDNLSSAISRAVGRIEKSYRRGLECTLYSQLTGFDPTSKVEGIGGAKQNFPQVFSMKPLVKNDEAMLKPSEDRHFAPASDDENQFNLLKFYELNAGAIKQLLESQSENLDLPFVPGPKERDIIHEDSKKTMLLQGRSGTGKTTCLVFRMWAQYMGNPGEAKRKRPRQLFVTKNSVLRSEVERSFRSMGLAWTRNVGTTLNGDKGGNSYEPAEFPLFLTASEWLDILDKELPGERYFTRVEMEKRSDLRTRETDDTVQRGMQALFTKDEASQGSGEAVIRNELTFEEFRRNWVKINSHTKTKMDPAFVWLEIKSYIKGSVLALKIEKDDRGIPENRFLTRDEYIDLPRKQSRIQASQRHLMYDIFLSYEKLKREGHFFDEMDVVYNIAGRLSLFTKSVECGSRHWLLPTDAVYVDEVQDFTQSELYLLAKLCISPNNLMLAGDTAQSIAVGVGFRFTDVRQIFYESFGGVKPTLCMLTENYRSHAGVLKLAAAVVELLYHFFSDSLDRLPPDFGLFPGPKPVIMEVPSVADLVLLLDGSKRETSRIEFGAHQVVLVRSKGTEDSLPQEFGVDPDWVMTVQEAKGLEFDDVLLYNFFTNSPARDLWRVISSYSKNDIEKYLRDCLQEVSLTSAGISTSFDWEEIDDALKTRELQFDPEAHKILESELKMLYTAITRARVNVFIAESDLSYCRPVFNYFKSRKLVDEMGKGDPCAIRIFGKLNTDHDWKTRGEYYLKMALGQRENVGCLRLAAKCFERGGEAKKRDYALAYLSFVELDDQEENLNSAPRRNAKKAPEYKCRQYQAAMQLLEAEDIDLLPKAGLCLARIGPEEHKRTAQIFEFYARVAYRTRGKNGKPLSVENEYFQWAAQLFERCGGIIDAFRCYMSCGGTIGASKLIRKNLLKCQKELFLDLVVTWRGYDNESFESGIGEDNTDVSGRQMLQNLMMGLAETVYETYYANHDESELALAMGVLSSFQNRKRVLNSLEIDLDNIIYNTPFDSHHDNSDRTLLAREKKSEKHASKTDALNILLEMNSCDKEAITWILEERLRLLERAETLAIPPEKGMVFLLKFRFLELMLGCSTMVQRDRKDTLSYTFRSVGGLFIEIQEKLTLNDKKLYALLQAKLLKQETDAMESYEECTDVLWQYDAVRFIIDLDRLQNNVFGKNVAEIEPLRVRRDGDIHVLLLDDDDQDLDSEGFEDTDEKDDFVIQVARKIRRR